MYVMDPKAVGVYEFARQMKSPKLKKINPNYNFTLSLEKPGTPPSIQAEFINGEKWTFPDPTQHAMMIRSMFFSKIQDIEDKYEWEFGGLQSAEEDGAGGKGASKGAKGGGKK
jgi:hypothetical protein